MKPKMRSPQRPEQFRFVNRFGAHFLKNRIQMMNNAAKSRRSWAVYVLLFAVTGLVTTMAAVEKQKKQPLTWVKKKSVSTPTLQSVISPAPVVEKTVPVGDPKIPEKPVAELVEKPAETPTVLPDNAPIVDEVAVPETKLQSRYVIRKDNMLYWVITPRMSFNELNELKKTIESETLFTFDFTQIKFDPFQVYIDIIGVNVHKEKGSAGSTGGGAESDEPIKSIGGYLTDKGSLGIGRASGNNFGMPEALERLVKEDEEIIAKLVEAKRIEYLILKTKKTGVGSSSTNVEGQWLRDNPGRRNEGLGVFVTPENRVQLYHPENVTVMIDGKEVKAEEATYLNPKQLHTVIVTDLPDNAAGPGRKKRYVQLFLNQW
ncbi:hypothetical protein [Larkinella rosea]|uniref:Uncharacterized protein n=1 Tax=Larkinella rosea TaxID=2025312 RepID=A0A3P1BCA3_9BACT|nr:hypothetical protein [Larkinella rosea]RRA98668.1 hypothetical protein EHT25_27090 [Larkinella rosea]